jgi:hypothetical protein
VQRSLCSLWSSSIRFSLSQISPRRGSRDRVASRESQPRPRPKEYPPGLSADLKRDASVLLPPAHLPRSILVPRRRSYMPFTWLPVLHRYAVTAAYCASLCAATGPRLCRSLVMIPRSEIYHCLGRNLGNKSLSNHGSVCTLAPTDNKPLGSGGTLPSMSSTSSCQIQARVTGDGENIDIARPKEGGQFGTNLIVYASACDALHK